MNWTNYDKGKKGEHRARRFLASQKYRILHSNWRCGLGEIDIIAMDGSFLCFIEVKYRKDTSFGRPSEAVDFRKRQKLIRLAGAYIAMETDKEENIRFDVVEITGSRINLIKDAFTSETDLRTY